MRISDWISDLFSSDLTYAQVTDRKGLKYAFTRQGSQVRTLYRPPSDARSHPCGGFFLCAELRNSDVFRHQRAPACHEARSSSALARLHARHGTCVSCPVQQASEGLSMERELFSIEQSARGWVVYTANGGNETPEIGRESGRTRVCLAG